MNQRKPNKIQGYLLGLALLLSVAFLVVSTGTALARYREERRVQSSLDVRHPEQICLGTVKTITEEEATADLPVGTEVFDPTDSPTWEIGSEVHKLQLAVANGISKEDCATRDQKIRLRLVGSSGLWMGDRIPEVMLRLPSKDDPKTYVEVKATVTEIEPGTPLYQANGPGWVYSFIQEEEIYWLLKGGDLSYTRITIVMKNEMLQAQCLIQPQVIAEVVRE